MITIKKLETLKQTTALRKIHRILEEAQSNLILNKKIDILYLSQIIYFLSESTIIEENLHQKILTVKEICKKETVGIRELLTLQTIIEKTIDIAPADWDFNKPSSILIQNKKSRKSMKASLFLEDIRSPFNLGSIFRTASAFSCQEIFLTENCPELTHHRTQRSAMGTINLIPSQRLNYQQQLDFFEMKSEKGELFALELGGKPISRFKFPENGIAIIGSEELGVSPEALNWANKSAGQVSIPLTGKKASLNVSVATGILLNTWINFINQNQ